jgi:hypothetical protein
MDAQTLRRLRNRLLAESDVEVLRHLERGEPVPPALADYRQELRDIPLQAGFPDQVEWPTPPTV